MTTPREPREPLDVQPIAERAAQATPGPWELEPREDRKHYGTHVLQPNRDGDDDGIVCEIWRAQGEPSERELDYLYGEDKPARRHRFHDDCSDSHWESEQDFRDAAFIAHAREDIPALLAEVQRLASDNARLRGLIAQAEWAAGSEWCPWCQHDEHAPNCPAFRAPGEPR